MSGANIGPSIFTMIHSQPAPTNSSEKTPVHGGRTLEITGEIKDGGSPSTTTITPPISPRDIPVVQIILEDRRGECRNSTAYKFCAFALPGAIAGTGTAFGLYPAMVGIPITLKAAVTLGGLGSCAQSACCSTTPIDEHNRCTIATVYGVGLAGASAGAAAFGLPPMPVTAFTSIATFISGGVSLMGTSTPG